MTWRDELQKGSFRGAPFETLVSSVAIGRRFVRHEYPKRDIPYIEDTGRKAREYKFDAFVIGDDYMDARDLLIDAIEEEGEGQLIHPYFGTLQVSIIDCQIQQSTNQGGYAQFTISFIETGEQSEPDIETDTSLVLENQVQVANTSIAADFSNAYSITDASDYLVSDSLSIAASFLAIPGLALGQLDSIRADPENALNALLPENILSSLNEPLEFAEAVQALIAQATSLVDLLNFSVDPVATYINTDSRQQQNNNRVALNNLFNQSASVQQINNLATTEVDTIDDAQAVKSEIVDRVDNILLSESTLQDSSNEIFQLRTDAINHFASITQDLPRLVPLTFNVSLPALAIVYDWYGVDYYDDNREDELIMRNKIRHPGFVKAGEPIYLLG